MIRKDTQRINMKPFVTRISHLAAAAKLYYLCKLWALYEDSSFTTTCKDFNLWRTVVLWWFIYMYEDDIWTLAWWKEKTVSMFLHYSLPLWLILAAVTDTGVRQHLVSKNKLCYKLSQWLYWLQFTASMQTYSKALPVASLWVVPC